MMDWFDRHRELLNAKADVKRAERRLKWVYDALGTKTRRGQTDNSIMEHIEDWLPAEYFEEEE